MGVLPRRALGGGPPTCAGSHNSGMGHGEGSEVPNVVLVPDSPDARLFVELSSHAADLTEARHALELAIEGRQDGSPLGDASRYLIEFATVAYCRTVLPSKVRRPLTAHVTVPALLEGVHEQVRTFRNATIAHSQSELAVTYPVGVLDPASLELKYVSGMTLSGTMPLQVIKQFLALIIAMVEELDTALEPVRARLESAMRSTDARELLARPWPQLLSQFPEEFNPRTKRPPYPSGQTLYWDHPMAGS